MSTQYFLDTNILIHLIRRDALGVHLINHYSLYVAEPRPMISDVTEGEVRSLAIQWSWGPQKLSQMEFLLSYFWRIAINSREMFKAYALIDAYSESNGITMGKNDVWIAAATHLTQTLLLTTDKDFDHLHAVLIERVYIDPSKNPTT